MGTNQDRVTHQVQSLPYLIAKDAGSSDQGNNHMPQFTEERHFSFYDRLGSDTFSNFLMPQGQSARKP